MKSSEAHAAAVNFLVNQNLTQKILLDIETMAAQGKFTTIYTTEVEYQFVHDVATCLRDIGYKVNITQDNGLNKLYINW